jgi:hypothetical protein
MSAVLPTPTLPTLLNMDDLKVYIDNEIQKGIEKALPAAVEKVLSDPENPIFIRAVENVLAISDLKILKRLYTHDKLLGLTDSDLEDEDREPTIPEQLIILSEKIDFFELNKAAVVQIQPEHIIPESKTEARAVFLVQYLEKEVKERNGELFLNGTEIKDLIVKTIPEKNPDCQIKKGQNIRKLKKDVLEKAAKLFPGNIIINKNKNGRHETRILFKPLLTVT